MNKTIPLFWPYQKANKEILKEVEKTLNTRWWGQGPKVDLAEKEFGKKFGYKYPLFVNSGTSALELAYHLVDIQKDDEVLTTVLTCLYGEETILLPNNKVKTIKDIVNSKYNGLVASYNKEKDSIEYKKVINWKKIPINNKQWIRLSSQNAQNSKSGFGKRGTWLTDNHRVLTINGYKEVGKLNKKDLIATKYRDLNKKQLEFVYGTMLGDSYIRFGRKYYNSCRFGVFHGYKQKELVKLKRDVLGDFNPNVFEKKAYKQSGKSIGFTINSSPRWNILRAKWYNDRKKILPNDLEKNFSPLSLAVWYMDDGSLNIKRDKYYSVVLCSESFTKNENKRLVKLLKKFGIISSIQKIRKNNKDMFRIYVGGKDNINKFFDIIIDYIPESMRYKVPEYISESSKFNKEKWDVGKTIMFYDIPVLIKNKRPNNRKDRLNFVYDIEVEDNHNFINKNYILHNCSATNIPLLRRDAKIKFVDINKNDFNISFEDLKKKITSKTKAVVAVDLGGIDIDRRIYPYLRSRNIPLILDSAQNHAPKIQKANYVCYSFQAIKTITTGDGGMLCLNNQKEYKRAKLLRWFGIDREQKAKTGWQAWDRRQMTFDIEEAGYKFAPTDIDASFLLVMLRHLDKALKHNRELAIEYLRGLESIDQISVVAGGSCWLFGILVEDRDKLAAYLKERGIETNLVHLRNDIFTVFKKFENNCPNMDYIESRYLYLPINTHVSKKDVKLVCKEIKSYYGSRS